MKPLVKENTSKAFLRLFDYVKAHNYEGNDLFDGLNSRLFKNSILYRNKYFRLALIQFCKRCPIDFRGIFMVPKGFNPKGGALFLLGHLNMFNATQDEVYKKEAEKLYSRLKATLIKREKGVAWGYNFDWQARAFYVPEGVPNVVTSVYIGKALIEYYETFNDNEALELVKQIAEFIFNEMVMFEDDDRLCFNYIPEQDAQVHNANLLAASFLASLNKYVCDESYANKITKALKFSIEDINGDGSWPYGTKPFHRWVDNFHTAFNIESLINIKDMVDMKELNEVINKVVNYYLNNLFTEQGQLKYYNDKFYPVDVHVLAEAVVVLNKIKSSDIDCDKQKLACIENEIFNLIGVFQDEKGYFYYQKNNFYWNKIPYIRWGQAWMFYALSSTY